MFRKISNPGKLMQRPFASLMLLALCISACQKVAPTGPEQQGASQNVLELTAVPSPKNIVHRKRADVLRNILYKALDLPDKRAVCTELGKKKLQCADVVHRVSLGRMEPYNNSQYQHPDGVSITSPLAFDRLILTACSQRALMDAATSRDNVLSDKEAIIFKSVKLTNDGRLVQNEAIDAAIVRLYQRGLARDPTPFEVQTIKDMYEEIFKENRIGSAINWMKLSCFVVFSSIEGAFY